MDDDDAAEVALPLKVLVLGDPAVGKTAYVRRLVRGQGMLVALLEAVRWYGLLAGLS